MNAKISALLTAAYQKSSPVSDEFLVCQASAQPLKCIKALSELYNVNESGTGTKQSIDRINKKPT